MWWELLLADMTGGWRGCVAAGRACSCSGVYASLAVWSPDLQADGTHHTRSLRSHPFSLKIAPGWPCCSLLSGKDPPLSEDMHLKLLWEFSTANIWLYFIFYVCFISVAFCWGGRNWTLSPQTGFSCLKMPLATNLWFDDFRKYYYYYHDHY